MLHIYKKSTWPVVNGELEVRLQYVSSVLRDESETNGDYIIKDATWHDMYQHAQSADWKWMFAYKTFWKKIPYLIPSATYWDESPPRFFEDDTTRFSVVNLYVLDKYYSMQDIMKVSNADRAIQWFKERGMAVCPMQ